MQTPSPSTRLPLVGQTPLPPGAPAASGANGASPDALREAAQQFEAIFVRQMLATARATHFSDDPLTSGQAMDTFTELRDAQFAEIAANSGSLGIARMLEAQLSESKGR